MTMAALRAGFACGPRLRRRWQCCAQSLRSTAVVRDPGYMEPAIIVFILNLSNFRR
jgi:hypothetical protein